jgi:hypothetical protein
MDPITFFSLLTNPKLSLFTKFKNAVNTYYSQGGRFSTSGDLVGLCELFNTFDDVMLKKLASVIEVEIAAFNQENDFFVMLSILGTCPNSIAVTMEMV